MGWKYRARKTFRLGRFTHNFTRSTTSVDTPGPGGFRKTWRRR